MIKAEILEALPKLNAEERREIRAKLKADLVEMEGAVIGQVCHELNLPHLVIRGGSNLAQESPGNDYKRLGQIAARSAALFTLHVLKQLPKLDPVDEGVCPWRY